jgi:hypothetical protein
MTRADAIEYTAIALVAVGALALFAFHPDAFTWMRDTVATVIEWITA